MKTITRVLQIALVAVLAAVSGLAQQAAPQRHVKDVRAQQSQKFIAASSLCQRVRSDGHAYIHRREVNPGMLEADLFTLMQNSDEVILASNFTDQVDVLAPSGEDAVEYYDTMVLRAFKGSHKVGDLVTFTLPRGGVYCGLKSIQGGVGNSGAVTLTGSSEWGKRAFIGPYILFLRQSRGEETELTPALRLAAGDGLQGMFALRRHYDRSGYTDCLSGLPAATAKCTAALEASQETVRIPYELDPLKTKYETMTVSSFLNEVQSVADSVGSAGQPSTAK
jgi:hypothetical protein